MRNPAREGVATFPKSVRPRLPMVSFRVCKRVCMHYYQFHIGDYASHTRHLSLIEDLAYRRLLDFYYLHEEPIRQREIARQIGMREHEQEVLSVLEEFFVSTEFGYLNPRADREIEHYHSKIEQASRAGKASAERRLNARSTDRSTDVQPTINQEPLTKNHIEEANASLSGTGFPPCPHGKILELWKMHLPHLSQPRTWEGARQAALRSRWNQASKKSSWSDGYGTTDDGLRWWDSFLSYIASDTKLSNGFESNGRVWHPDLPWILNATNFAKIIDGKYQK